MRIRWFGPPWPSAELRAPICDDDQFRVATPVGHTCLACTESIVVGERGVVMAASPRIEGAWRAIIDGYDMSVCAYHIDCHIESMLAGQSLVSRRAF